MKQTEEGSPVGAQTKTVQLGKGFGIGAEFQTMQDIRSSENDDRGILSRAETQHGLLGGEPKLIPIDELSADNAAGTMIG